MESSELPLYLGIRYVYLSSFAKTCSVAAAEQLSPK